MVRLRRENETFRREILKMRSTRALIGDSASFRRVMETIATVAPTRATVLLQGESGTGKELFARALHDQSPRHDAPFITMNCAAMPEGLVESALFGHEKGAFTGATVRTAGAFERSHKGTLLLDEISEMRLDLQAKLLRVIQEQEFERVGGTQPIKVDVRLVATTNRDLKAEVDAGRFRSDLYYRLNVVPIRTPPLRERPEDIPAPGAALHAPDGGKPGHPVPDIAPETVQSCSATAGRGTCGSWPTPSSARSFCAAGRCCFPAPSRSSSWSRMAGELPAAGARAGLRARLADGGRCRSTSTRSSGGPSSVRSSPPAAIAPGRPSCWASASGPSATS